MNYIKHLTGFFNKSNQDKNINPTHISLYLALFQRWNLNRFKNPIIISREEMMISSKIKSKGTYHKCMKELHNRGYIIYKPSYNPYEGTEVILPDLSINCSSKDNKTSPNFERTASKNEPTKSKAQPKNELLPHKINKNASASSNFDRTEPDNEPTKPRTRLKNDSTVSKNSQVNRQVNEQVYNIYNNKTLENNNKTIIIPEKKIKKINSKFLPPTIELVTQFFQEKKVTGLEAEKYFNYYSSNGWKIGGKTQMKDWQAAARNWILNLDRFSPKTTQSNLNPKNLNVSNSKDYAEPL